MMPETTVSFTPEFKRNVRRLARKYRNISVDIEPIIAQLEQGKTPGDQIQRANYTLFKVRARNSDAKRGKSGGYRVIYYLRTSADVILVTIYSKTEQGDVTTERIHEIISQY